MKSTKNLTLQRLVGIDMKNAASLEYEMQSKCKRLSITTLAWPCVARLLFFLYVNNRVWYTDTVSVQTAIQFRMVVIGDNNSFLDQLKSVDIR